MNIAMIPCGKINRVALGSLQGKSMDFIAELFSEIKTKQNYSAYSQAIENCARKHPEMQFLSPNWYKIGDKYLKLGTRTEAELYKSRLPMLTKEGITISPIYRNSATSLEGFSATLLEVPGTQTGDLHHFNDAYHLLKKETKEKAYEDVRKLTEDMGFINPAVFDPKNLGITPDSANQKIIVTDWNNFNPLALYCPKSKYNALKKEVLSKAQELFFRK